MKIYPLETFPLYIHYYHTCVYMYIPPILELVIVVTALVIW